MRDRHLSIRGPAPTGIPAPATMAVAMVLLLLTAAPAAGAPLQDPPSPPVGPRSMPQGVVPPVPFWAQDRDILFGASEDASLDRPGARRGIRSAEARATAAAMEEVAEALYGGRVWASGAGRLSRAAQYRVRAVIRDGSRVQGERLVEILVPDVPTDGEAYAERTEIEGAAWALVEHLSGLADRPWGLRPAVRAYNAYIDRVPPPLLEDPPPELLAVRWTLTALAEGVRGADGRR